MISNAERATRFKDARGNRSLKEIYQATKENGNPVSASMISDLESVSIDRPVQYQKIVALADVYKVNVAWLMGQSGSPSINENMQTVSKTTGLSDKAIEVLNTIKGTDLSRTLNKLLESNGFAEMLMQFNNALIINDNDTQSEKEAETIENLQMWGIINGMDSQNSRLSNRQLIDVYRRKAVESISKAFIQIMKEDKKNGTR